VDKSTNELLPSRSQRPKQGREEGLLRKGRKMRRSYIYCCHVVSLIRAKKNRSFPGFQNREIGPIFTWILTLNSGQTWETLDMAGLPVQRRSRVTCQINRLDASPSQTLILLVLNYHHLNACRNCRSILTDSRII